MQIVSAAVYSCCLKLSYITFSILLREYSKDFTVACIESNMQRNPLKQWTKLLRNSSYYCSTVYVKLCQWQKLMDVMKIDTLYTDGTELDLNGFTWEIIYICDIGQCMAANRLKLDPDKTGFLGVGTCELLTKVTQSLTVGSCKLNLQTMRDSSVS